MDEIRLPLSALERADACELSRRTTDFATHHGHPPTEASTWAEWCAVIPDLGDRLWAVACALPQVYPARRAELLRVVVAVAYRAARRAQAPEPSPPAAAALDLTRRWLDGEAISAATLRAATATVYADADADYAAADAAYAAAAAAACASAAADYAAADVADAADAAAAAAAADYAAYDAAATCGGAIHVFAAAERALQAQDLEELLAALRLEVLDA